MLYDATYRLLVSVTLWVFQDGMVNKCVETVFLSSGRLEEGKTGIRRVGIQSTIFCEGINEQLS